MTYNLYSPFGSITVPHLTTIDYNGLTLVGRDTPNWNLPIQQNFVVLADRATNLESTVNDLYTKDEVNSKIVELAPTPDYTGLSSEYTTAFTAALS